MKDKAVKNVYIGNKFNIKMIELNLEHVSESDYTIKRVRYNLCGGVTFHFPAEEIEGKQIIINRSSTEDASVNSEFPKNVNEYMTMHGLSFTGFSQ